MGSFFMKVKGKTLVTSYCCYMLSLLGKKEVNITPQSQFQKCGKYTNPSAMSQGVPVPATIVLQFSWVS